MTKIVNLTNYYPYDKDNYGEIIFGQKTYKFILNKLISTGMCCLRIGFQNSTAYNMVFIYLSIGRRYKRPEFTGDLRYKLLNWSGGGDLYIGIETIGGYSFALKRGKNNSIHPEYVREKLNLKDIVVAQELGYFIDYLRG